MPIMDGKEACRQIRQYEKEKKIPQIQIILVTGYATENEKNECLNPEGDIKADLFYRKPMTFRDCENLVHQLVQKLSCPIKETKEVSHHVLEAKAQLERSSYTPVMSPNDSPKSFRSSKEPSEAFNIQKNLKSVIVKELLKPLKIDNIPSDFDEDSKIPKKYLLFIQECAVNQKLVTDLEKAGFKIVTANSFNTSIDVIKKYIDKLTSILIDCDGIEIEGFVSTIKILSYLKAPGRDWSIPIYGMTSLDRPFMVTKGKNCGMKNIIFKPIDMEKIESILF